MSLIGRDPLHDAPKLVRKEFTYRGRKYVAIRFRGGRVELYRAAGSDGIETWLGYARVSGGPLDRIAIGLVEDKLDPAAIEARMLLTHGTITSRRMGTEYSNIRMGESVGRWGGVEYERRSSASDGLGGRVRSFTSRASIPLYSELGEPVRERDYRPRTGRDALAYRDERRRARERKAAATRRT